MLAIDPEICDSFLAQNSTKLVILPSDRQSCRQCLANVPAKRTRDGAINEACMNGMRSVTLGVITLILLTLSGCGAMLHELQPHRLWRLNYQPQSGNSDGSYGSYFSVDDPLDKAIKTDRIHEPAAE